MKWDVRQSVFVALGSQVVYPSGRFRSEVEKDRDNAFKFAFCKCFPQSQRFFIELLLKHFTFYQSPFYYVIYSMALAKLLWPKYF